MLSKFIIDKIIETALLEDINYIDVSSDYLLNNISGTAYFQAKSDGVLCGVNIALRVFEFTGNPSYKVFKQDGEHIQKGDIILEIEDFMPSLLKAERTSLNFIQHLSGIATYTRKCADIIEGTSAHITDTRKTIPGMRALQKYAVTCGGGKNHRYNLTDAAMLKDNHIDAYGSITRAVCTLRKKIGHTVKIEVETRNLEEVKEALKAGADIIMLDNMSLDTIREAVSLIKKVVSTPTVSVPEFPLIEVSGGITLENLRSYSETGVDIISIGALTHSVTAFDISMKIKQS